MSSLTAWMRVRIRRRSVSSLVSPGPRVPMPPPSRDSAAPGADQPRQQVLQLRQLDLQLAFARPRAPGEDVENQLRAIDDLAADRLLDLPQLRRRQLVVEDDDVDVASRRTTRPASRPCRRRETSTGRASAAPAARAARPRAPAASARPASSSSERSASSRRARPATRPTSAARSGAWLRRRVEPCLNLVPRNRAGAHQRGAGSGDVDDRRRRPAGVRPASSSRSTPIAERPLRPRRDRPTPARR